MLQLCSCCILLFFVYITDLHKSMKYCSIRHFADDTNLLISNISPKKIQDHVNSDLKHLCRWLRANIISLNKSKTELLIFKHPNKKINHEFKLKMDGKKLYPSKYVKYLGVLIVSHMNSISTKLSRVVGLLSKIRHYVKKDTLRSIYFGIFPSILTYASQIWGQIKSRHFIRLVTHKAIKIINFANFRNPVTPLYKAMKIIKLSDNIRINNFLFVFDDFSRLLPPALQNAFQLSASSFIAI